MLSWIEPEQAGELAEPTEWLSLGAQRTLQFCVLYDILFEVEAVHASLLDRRGLIHVG